MTTAGDFITALQQEQRIGNVSSETEQHLKHEFRKLGRDASGRHCHVWTARTGPEQSD
jgi:hypothetical protein